MGAVIARLWAAAGSDVCVTTSSRTSREEALRRIDGRGVTWVASVEDAARGASFVLESLPEDLELKRNQLRLAQAAAPAALLMTNTSSLRVGEIASVLDDPSRLVGAHFFNPPDLIRLVEVVGGESTAPAAIAEAEAELIRIGQQPVRVKQDSPGFVINRLQFALVREAVAIVDQGIADAEVVDRVVAEGLGPRWAAAGPFETVALGGPELFERIARLIYPVLSAEREPNGGLDRLSLTPDELRAARERRSALLGRLFEALAAHEGQS